MAAVLKEIERDLTSKMNRFLSQREVNRTVQSRKKTKCTITATTVFDILSNIGIMAYTMVTYDNTFESWQFRDMVAHFHMLQTGPQVEQLSEEWHRIRKTLLTGTDVAVVLKRTLTVCKPYMDQFNLPISFADGRRMSKYGSVKELERKKHNRGKPYQKSPNTSWGLRFEKIALDVYQRKANKKVEMFGLRIHPTKPWLGASPDGIATDGTMVEIKCPKTRILDGKPTPEYWVQCQINLEVHDLYDMDYVEAEFIEYMNFEHFYGDLLEDFEEKGIYIYVEDDTSIAPPLDMTDVNAQIEWAELQIAANPNYSVRYWKLVYLDIIRIKRNWEWFKSIEDHLVSQHKRIMELDPLTLTNYNPEMGEVQGSSRARNPYIRQGPIMADEDVC